MANFNVTINYSVDSTVVNENQVKVSFTLICSAANLTKEFSEIYPHAMYFQNIDPNMNANDLQTQMKGNFLTLAKITIEEFANEAKAIIKTDQAETVQSDINGTIALSNNSVIYISYGTEPFSFTVFWA